jgi:hypothetical protein
MWQGATLQDAFDNTAAQNGEGALRYGFAHSRRDHRVNCFLCFRVVSGRCFGMLKQSRDQRPFLWAENARILHQRFGKGI